MTCYVYLPTYVATQVGAQDRPQPCSGNNASFVPRYLRCGSESESNPPAAVAKPRLFQFSSLTIPGLDPSGLFRGHRRPIHKSVPGQPISLVHLSLWAVSPFREPDPGLCLLYLDPTPASATSHCFGRTAGYLHPAMLHITTVSRPGLLAERKSFLNSLYLAASSSAHGLTSFLLCGFFSTPAAAAERGTGTTPSVHHFGDVIGAEPRRWSSEAVLPCQRQSLQGSSTKIPDARILKEPYALAREIPHGPSKGLLDGTNGLGQLNSH
ncbi:hypothetical protein LZ30DRAFT_684720 [Colletotrichum cereale]|nr:hypothetical protein LZ30DRAFT_684720 [Colletotrichum cereale]